MASQVLLVVQPGEQIIGRAADAGPIDVTFDTGDDTIVVSKKLRRKNCGE